MPAVPILELCFLLMHNVAPTGAQIKVLKVTENKQTENKGACKLFSNSVMVDKSFVQVVD